MFLTIKNIGKIKESTIEMQGITVIAGENNTGKSTFGKVLYCIFNAFRDSEAAIHNERLSSIKQIFRRFIHPNYLRRINDKMFERFIENENILDKINELKNSNDNFNFDDKTINLLQESIEKYNSFDNDYLQKVLITGIFDREFNYNINHINKLNADGRVILNIKQKNIEINIKSNKCINFSDNIGIIHEAICFDTPLVIDNIINGYNIYIDPVFIRNHRSHLIDLLQNKSSDITILEEAIIKQKINNILSNINSLVLGEFQEEEDGLYFYEKYMQFPLPIQSISTGLKTFLIIKRLLEMGKIKERDVLILDEPEIHLHPDWQIKFAELLVLLQKEFDLTILLTTHSPYFLHAIEVYSEKYNMAKNTNFYLAKNDEDTSFVIDVTNDIEKVYKQLAAPFEKLDDVVYPNS